MYSRTARTRDLKHHMVLTAMDFILCMLIVTSVVGIAKAGVKCHDCSSWNPYCKEKVDEPFESAVAAVECEKTSTCFLKKDESGVINRGCADWWMESQVDMGYVGCQTQHVPWLGEMTWCFCKEDYCNGGSIEMLADKVYPEVKEFPKQEWGDYVDWEGEGEEEDWEGEENEVEEEGGQGGWDKEGKGHGKTFDDVNPGYLGSAGRKDPKYQLWFWHADSDRPLWEKEEDGGEGWRAPDWVEDDDGKGWDFPVTGRVHNHAAEETTRDYDENDYDYNEWSDAATADEDDASSPHTWSWGNGWGHIKPWWLRDEEEGSTPRPNRWTPHPTGPPHQQDDGYEGLPSKWDDAKGWDQNSLDDKDYDDSKDNAMLEISRQEFFCWDCYSDSPLCGESVETQKAMYLGKTACSATNKCFVRRDNGVIYRGCADGWTSSSIETNYVGCRVQQMWNREVEWCFCTASLCNGDSMARINDKYHAQLEPFRASTVGTTTTEGVVANTTTTAAAAVTAAAAPVQTTVQPLKSAAASRDKTTPRHLQKRSTLAGGDNSSTDFHVEKESESSSVPNRAGISAEDSTDTNAPTGSWQTTNTGSDSTGNRNEADANSNKGFMNGTNYKALFG